MSKTTLIFSAAIVLMIACKSRQSSTAAVQPQSTPGTTVGVVSHKFSKDGCPVVITVKEDSTEMTLVPKDTLAKKLNVDGKQIRFNYRLLKMAQNPACGGGIPAEISDVTVK